MCAHTHTQVLLQLLVTAKTLVTGGIYIYIHGEETDTKCRQSSHTYRHWQTLVPRACSLETPKHACCHPKSAQNASTFSFGAFQDTVAVTQACWLQEWIAKHVCMCVCAHARLLLVSKYTCIRVCAHTRVHRTPSTCPPGRFLSKYDKTKPLSSSRYILNQTTPDKIIMPGHVLLRVSQKETWKGACLLGYNGPENYVHHTQATYIHVLYIHTHTRTSHTYTYTYISYIHIHVYHIHTHTRTFLAFAYAWLASRATSLSTSALVSADGYICGLPKSLCACACLCMYVCMYVTFVRVWVSVLSLRVYMCVYVCMYMRVWVFSVFADGLIVCMYVCM